MNKKKTVWIAAGSLVLATAAIYTIWRNGKQTKERPPAKAPQLHLENPGDQSDFPAAPSGAQELG